MFNCVETRRTGGCIETIVEKALCRLDRLPLGSLAMTESLSGNCCGTEWKPQPDDRSVSAMRRYLESDAEFTWPPDCGECQGNYCDLQGRSCIPLSWIRKISDRNASIDVYQGDARYSFREPFVVKTVRESGSIKSHTKANHEVQIMRELRHPHIAALLGTFLYLDRLSILIFPAACCDLAQYMATISKELAAIRQENSYSAEAVNISEGLQTPDSTASSVRTWHAASSPVAVLSREDLTSVPGVVDYSWPLTFPYQRKLDSLRIYFVCLAQALSYIHGSNIRHKDIKPQNILIDSSGSVVVTDFGISKSFPNQASHMTNGTWQGTSKYASPELMNRENVPRGDPSDVFSLGCVFLEMATLVLGKSLNSLSAHHAKQKNDTGLVQDAYHCNLDRVHTWIDGLNRPRQDVVNLEQTLKDSLAQAQMHNHDSIPESIEPVDPEKRMVSALGTIRQMLDETPTARPKAKSLWTKFQCVSSDICRDCDPRHPEVWRPSAAQKQKLEEGINGQSIPAAQRVSSADSRWQSIKKRGSTEIPPGLTSPNASALGLSRLVSDPGAASPQNGSRLDLRHQSQPSIPNNLPAATRSPNADTCDSIIQTPVSPTASQHAVKSNSWGGWEKQAQRATSTDTVRYKPDKVSDTTDVIIYDYSLEKTYVAPYIALRGREYRSYALPKLDRHVEIGDKENIIAKIDLGTLSWWTRTRRIMGDFPRIYVV